ncbi:imm11 family protein [Ostreibacterium oceani]|uniref:Immunity MXAN-0049 protein domain-containing protein n=1 Tax=Ostreibacterium oceani TaxID=2654998 RepID=A0A6N7EYP3_9GAMM|nr:DUF1629 domain-containing protein [Ostreibacterium oceani]MPV86499.1 hypothetical protein [Ostreibacterium oceani]
MKYFELNDDINFPNRWYLGDISEVDNWELSTSIPEGTVSLNIEIVRNGEEMDFTFTEAYGVPVVSLKVKEALDGIQGINFIPLQVLGRQCSTKYFVLVTNEIVECVDEANSEFQKFEENDPVRPDKAGEYRAFMKLRLDASKIVGIDIFRLMKFEVAVIVSERVKQRLESVSTTGLDLTAVV